MLKTKLVRLVVSFVSLIVGSDPIQTASGIQFTDVNAVPRRLHKWQPYREDSYFHYLPH